MTQLETLLQNDPQVQQFALAVLNECDGMRDFAARCVEAMINSAMSAQADELCGAGYNERSEERVNSRNGYRTRGLETTVGDIEIEIPKLRHGTYYPEGVVEHWQRADNALVACVVEMYANGISTAKVERVAKQLGVGSMSKSQVSRLCAALDEEVAQLRESDLFGHVVRYVWVDATYVSCRVAGRFTNVAVVTAIGCDETGHKRFLGLDVVDVESYEDWRRFPLSLRERGLDGVRLVVSDAHAGLVRAVSEVFLGASWQRCVTHFMRNAADAYKGTVGKQRLVREALKATFAQTEPTLVRVLPRGVGAPARPRVPEGLRAHGRGRGVRALLPLVPRRAREEDKDRQRPGAREPRDKEAHGRRAVLPLQGVAAQARRRRALRGERVLAEDAHVQRGLHSVGGLVRRPGAHGARDRQGADEGEGDNPEGR